MNLDRNISVRITDYNNQSFDFENLKKFYNFLKKEAEFWTNKESNIGSKSHLLIRCGSKLKSAIQQIDGWQGIENWDDHQLQRQVNNLQQNQLNQLSLNWLWSDNEFVPKFIECHSPPGSHNIADAYLNFMVKGSVNPSTKEGFTGALLGYEYTFQNTDITKRKKSERASIAKLRDQLDSSNQQLIDNIEENKSNWEQWYEDTQNSHSIWERKTNKNTRNLLKAGINDIRNQHKELDLKFNEKNELWLQKINDLESIYQEKLRLEKPAEYWAKSAKRLKTQGIIFTAIIILIVLIGFTWLTDTFHVWLISGTSPLSLNSIQGLVLFTASAALFAYGLRVLSRLAFSSFHLMRDSEEREQLTYLYLSLSNESDVDERSREIVLQALFSRSETGLLVNESGPTMPGASEVLRSVLRSKS